MLLYLQINSSSISSHADLSYSVQNANTSYSSDHQTVLSDSFNEDFNQVKDLFRFIWDSLKNLW